jgi:hypothetical protein
MQSKILLGRTGCAEPAFKDWVRKGVILPAHPGRGAGIRAEYDEANAVALLVAIRMKQAAITVTAYAQAFDVLQTWLRGCSSLEWHQYVVAMMPEHASLYRVGKAFNLVNLSFIVPLAPICAILSETAQYPAFYQYSLLSLQAVGNPT